MRKIVLVAGIMLAQKLPVFAQADPGASPQKKAKYILEKLTHYDAFTGSPLGDVGVILAEYFDQKDSLLHDPALTPELSETKIILLRQLRDEKLKIKLTNARFITWHNEVEPLLKSEKID